MATARSSAASPSALGIAPLVGVAALAGAVRLIGLGDSRLWLDEILETLMSRGSLAELVRSLLADRVHPPIEPLLAWGLQHLGAGELARRAVGALIGVATVTLLAAWAGRRFGRSVGFGAGLVAATSPLLLRYSHELRPYGLSLLLSLWLLIAVDRWLAGGARALPWELIAAAALAGLTHYFAIVVWVPVAVACWEERARLADPAGALRRLAAAAGLALLPLALWLAAVFGSSGIPEEFASWSWTPGRAVDRWLQLFLVGYAGQPVARGIAWLFLPPVLLGLRALLGRRGGWTVLAGAAAGTVGVELLLGAGAHFSHPRYDLYGLLFWQVVLAAGLLRAGELAGRGRPRRARWVAGVGFAALLAGAGSGVLGYARRGRPDWPAVARAVRALEGDAARVLVGNGWTQISLGHALGRFDHWPILDDRGVVSVAGERERLAAELASRRGCQLLVTAGYPDVAAIARGFRPERPVAEQLETDAARIYRFAGAATALESCLPPPTFAVESSPGAGELLPWLTRR